MIARGINAYKIMLNSYKNLLPVYRGQLDLINLFIGMKFQNITGCNIFKGNDKKQECCSEGKTWDLVYNHVVNKFV